jgi:autotransporter-associated beta strand protein
MRTKSIVFVFCLQSHILCAAVSASWTNAAHPVNDWTNNANWMSAEPNGQDDQATFSTPTAGGGTTVVLDMPRTIGIANFDYGTAYILNTSALTFSVSSGSALINVTSSVGAALHDIQTPVTLSSPLTVSQNSATSFTISGAITGAQAITKTGTGTLILSNGSNLYSGGTIINGGTISVTVDGDLGNASGGVTLGAGTLLFTNSALLTTNRTFTLTGAASVNTSSSSMDAVTIGGAIGGTGSLTKLGSETLILSSANTYQGGTTLTAGMLEISNDSQLGSSSGPLNFGNGTLRTISTGITSSRSGTITGNPATFDTNSLDSTLTGTFSGAGRLVIEGGGLLTLAPTTGASTYSGGTTLSGASLTGNTNGVQGAIAVGGNTLTFDQSFNGTYSGVISGAGTLNKSGTGTVTLTGANTFTGNTHVNAGTLTVNGSLSSSALDTLAGATLSGSGTVGATTNAGTIDPGNGSATGTLNVNTSLTLQAAPAAVAIAIAPLSSDKIAVTGTAALDGALTITPASGFYGFSASYTILTSTGNTSGTFATVTSTNSAFIPTVTYPTVNETLLTVAIIAPFAAFNFSNDNTKAVGDNIDDLSIAHELSSGLVDIFNTFVGESDSAINSALDQMHPAPYSAFTEMQAEMGGQLLSLFHRLPYRPHLCNRGNRFWIEPFGNSLTMKHHGMQFGFQGNSTGVAFGYDGEAKENFILGFGGAWNRGWLKWHDHHGHGTLDGFYGSAYFDWTIDQFYLGGTFLGGIDFYETNRHLKFTSINRHAKAHPLALDFMGQIKTAYLFGSPYAFLYPYANVDFLYLHTHEFQERGAGALNLTVQNRTDSTLRSEMGIGFQVQDVNMDETICLSPQISIGWVNMCPIQREGYRAVFQGESISFITRGWDMSWNLLNVDFGLTLAFCSFSLGLDYNVELSPDQDTTLFNQNGTLLLEWKW